MADYKGIHGGKVQNFSTNPPAPIAGQVWYNETTATINYFSSNPTGSWAAGNNMNTARRQIAGAGIQTAGLAFGGFYAPEQYTGLTEAYDGSSWTEVGDLNTGRHKVSGTGLQTAALAFGGINPSATLAVSETYDGSSWTEGPDLGTARERVAGAGTNTAALCSGGYVSANSALTEEFQGTVTLKTITDS